MTALAIQSFGAVTAAGPNAARTMGAIHARIQLFLMKSSEPPGSGLQILYPVGSHFFNRDF